MGHLLRRLKVFYFPLTVGFFLTVHLLWKLAFVFYGYIASEEGTLIYNQQLAYRGSLPFIDYDAWNSFLSDYLVGWYQLYLPGTILIQRLWGFFLAIAIAILTLKLALYYKNKIVLLTTAILLTFGSFMYTYIGTIPYSETLMSFFLLLALLLFSKDQHRQPPIFRSTLTIFLSCLAIFVRIQALPVTLLFVLYELWRHRSQKKYLIFIPLFAITTFFVFSLPFLIRSPELFLHGFTWPLRADKLLIYQMGTKLTLSSFLIFVQELIRDYYLFLIVIIPGLVYYLAKTRYKDKLLLWLLIISGSFLLTGLIHKPPFASYLYPAVPFLAVAGGVLLQRLFQDLPTAAKTYLSILLGLIIAFHTLTYPHYKFLKTSLSDIRNTPHTYLEEIAIFVKNNSNESDEILTFYTPIAVAAHRKIPLNFSRDRFSMSLLSQEEAKRYHLSSPEWLWENIVNKNAKMIIFSDSALNFSGRNASEVAKTKLLIQGHYNLLKSFDTMLYIENPKATSLYVYYSK